MKRRKKYALDVEKKSFIATSDCTIPIGHLDLDESQNVETVKALLVILF